MTDVVLVQMPFAGLERPSIALGLISATLKARAISTRSLYANIAFAERTGPDVHRLIERSSLSSLAGEWLFAEAAFGPRADRGGDRLHVDICARDLEPKLLRAALECRGLEDAQALLYEVREAARAFVIDQARRILAMEARIVGTTTMFQQHTASLALLREIKRRNPDVITVIGGANCAGVMGRTTHRAFDWIDYTAIGEIDLHVGCFFASLLDRSREDPPATLPPNFLGPADRGALEHNSPSASDMAVNMDSVATPDYDDYFEALSASTVGRYIFPSIQFESSRGCWWGVRRHCTFCGLNANGMAYRLKSPDRVRREIEHLTEKYCLRRLSAVDNIIDYSYFRTLLPALALDDIDYEIFYETKANLKREQVEILARSGVRWIQPGIESLHDETLQLIRKGTTAVINIQLLIYCLEFGVQPSWNMLVGVPGERPEWIASVGRLLPLLFHLPPPQGAGPVRFDRFSPYFEHADDYGLSLEPFDCYREIYPLDESDVRNIAYYFQDAGGTAARERTEAWADEFRRLTRIIREWQGLFFGEKPPKLIAEDTGEEIAIHDTRPATPDQIHVLTGIGARIYRLMRASGPNTESRIVERLRGWGECDVPEERITQEISDLVEKGLAWRTKAHVIALASTSPARELPSWTQVPPWGTVNLGAFFVDHWRFLAWKRSSAAAVSGSSSLSASQFPRTDGTGLTGAQAEDGEADRKVRWLRSKT